jgi:hypothetical protein
MQKDKRLYERLFGESMAYFLSQSGLSLGLAGSGDLSFSMTSGRSMVYDRADGLPSLSSVAEE